MRIRGRHSKTIAFQRAVLKKGKARIDARNKMFHQLEEALGRGDEEVTIISPLACIIVLRV